ncbi:hypothetical protein SUGI_0607520 [Cryptomeria japonica]|nr:hypothetical protein SUGI_0607520 [Cryptomeria japonica]
MTAIEEMKKLGIEPNLKTYTTLIHGWALASHPEKALACFEEMKQVGWEPDEAVYHCLMTSLLSRATFAQSFVYSGILRISKEMLDRGFSVDLGTATYWSKSLRILERVPSELTSSVEKLYPPNWSSYTHGSFDAKYTYSSENNKGDLNMCSEENKDHVQDWDELQTFGRPC